MPAAKPNGRALVLAEVARGARLSRGYLMLVALSAALAHIGLLQNSAPVIIGAMLISPLLGPIMGLGFGLAVFENKLLRRSFGTLAAGVALAIAVTWAITLISPVRDVTPPILSRIRPSLLDLFVAVFGGVAGAYALLRKNALGIAGVAIATALVPPLAVVGFGLATRRLDFAGGALLLFVTNSAAIALMTTATARVKGFGTGLSHRQTLLQTVAIFGSIAALALPLGLSLDRIVRQSQARAAVHDSLQALAGDAARISSIDLTYESRPIQLDAVVIVPRFDPRLEAAWYASARRTLGRAVEGRLLQLRVDSEQALRDDERVSRRLVDIEQRDREIDRIAGAVIAATGLTRETIMVDPQARVVEVPLPQASDAAERAARIRALAAVSAAFPDWRVVNAVRVESPQVRILEKTDAGGASGEPKAAP